MSLLTFAKTALGSMVKQPVTVCYECIESCPKHCLSMDTARTPVAADKTPTVETKPE
ncbi:MAG: hypothetical protein KH064_00250 [Collinsella sp.]|nr:hypothetical protein [Collinsella sp.]